MFIHTHNPLFVLFSYIQDWGEKESEAVCKTFRNWITIKYSIPSVPVCFVVLYFAMIWPPFPLTDIPYEKKLV